MTGKLHPGAVTLRLPARDDVEFPVDPSMIVAVYSR
jgi:hypothetical protein